MDINKIYLGDCFTLLKDLPENSIDLLLTDPPYNITACHWDVKIDINTLWILINRVCKPKANIVIFSKQPFTTLLINPNIKNFRYQIIWNKECITNYLSVEKQPGFIHEEILVFKNKIAGIYNPQFTKAPPYYKKRKDTKIDTIRGIECKAYSQQYEGKRYLQSIITVNSQEEDLNNFRRYHSTQKPIKLLSLLIKMFSNPGDIILDPFSGSGSTLVASKELHRGYIGIELDKKYYDISIKRVNEVNNLL